MKWAHENRRSDRLVVRSSFQCMTIGGGASLILFGVLALVYDAGIWAMGASVIVGAHFIMTGVTRSAEVDTDGLRVRYNLWVAVSLDWAEVRGLCVVAEDRNALRVWVVSNANLMVPIPPGIVVGYSHLRMMPVAISIIDDIAMFAPDAMRDDLMLEPTSDSPLRINLREVSGWGDAGSA